MWAVLLGIAVTLGAAVVLIVVVARRNRPDGGWREAAQRGLAERRQRRADRRHGIIRPPDPTEPEPTDISMVEMMMAAGDDGPGYQEPIDVREVLHAFRPHHEHAGQGETPATGPNPSHDEASTPGGPATGGQGMLPPVIAPQDGFASPPSDGKNGPERAPRVPPPTR